MLRDLRPALVLLLLFTLFTGLALPVAISGVAGFIFPFQARGSLISRDGVVIGSALIGQNFTSERYFHGRPSAITDTSDPAHPKPTPYDAANSSAANLAPTAKSLIDRVKGDIAGAGPVPVPADAVTTSASGLDPDISPENAARQVARVAAARHLPEARVRGLVAAHTAGRARGFIGEPRVNVLALNLALDALPPE